MDRASQYFRFGDLACPSCGWKPGDNDPCYEVLGDSKWDKLEFTCLECGARLIIEKVADPN